MNIDAIEKLQGKTIESLIDPTGVVKLSYFQTLPVMSISLEAKKGLLWYHEDENSFVVEEQGSETLLFHTFKSVDDLIHHHWVIEDNL